MTATELIQPIGKTVLVKMAEFAVPCTITNTKESWGRVRFEVTPIHGEGSAWIEDGRIIRVIKENSLTVVK